MARRGRGQFEFTVVELAVLAVSFTATAVLVFLLGLYVGREVASQHAPVDERVARIPVSAQPPAGPAPLELPEEATAVSKLAPGSASPQPARPQPRPDPQRTPPEVAPAAVDQGVEALARRALERRAEPVERRPPSPPAMAYTVQVLATRNRREAESLAANLKSRGFGAFVTAVEDAQNRWYRVRIGRYDSQQSARSMAERCRSQLGLSQAFVSPYRTSTVR